MENASTSKKMPVWLTLCHWVVLVCLGQFLVFGSIGVIRGYSVQSLAPFWIMLGGAILASVVYVANVFVFSKELREKKTWREFFPRQFIRIFGAFYLSLFFLGLVIIVGIQQGRYQKQADELYKQKNYPAAIAMYQKEVGTWYFRLKYNYHEAPSLFGIAQAYCQLGDFEQGRQAYQRLLKMERGYYQEPGQQKLAELDTELENIAEFKKQLAEATDDNQKANILFDMALSYRMIECAEKAREQYELIQTLNVPESRKEQAKEFAADERW